MERGHLRMQNKKESTILKDTFALFLITLISGLCLGFVYELTLPAIQKLQDEQKAAAYQTVYADAKYFRDEAEQYKDVITESPEKLAATGITGVTIEEVLQAQAENGDVLGYVMKVTCGEGYGGDITLAVGIKNDGTVVGVDTLILNETSGLGSRASESEFKDQFKDKNVDEFVVKKGDAAADNEINAISGATITTNAVTKAVNATVYYVKNCLSN